MSLKFYNNYIENVAVNPNTKYREDLQSLIDAQWDNTTTVYTVEEESELRDFNFNEIEVRVNHVIDEVTTGRKNGDDFRKIIFKSLKHNTEQGRYYKFDNNYWLTTFNDEYNSVVKSIIVRRCNNFAKYVSPLDGSIISIPCILDYTASSPSPQVSTDIITPNNHIVMIIQGNEKTIEWMVNKRFIFNQRPYKITGYNNYMQNNYVDANAQLLYFDLFLDEIHADDDLVNNVANSGQFNYSINLMAPQNKLINGYKGTIEAFVFCNGGVVDRELVWTSLDENSSVDNDGNFEIIGSAGSVAQIRAELKGNSNVCNIVTIEIVDSFENEISIVVSPDFDQIKQGQTQNFTAYVYINGEKSSKQLIVNLSGVEEEYYNFVEENNDYSLKCLYPAQNNLVLTFIYNDVSLVKTVKLLPLF